MLRDCVLLSAAAVRSLKQAGSIQTATASCHGLLPASRGPERFFPRSIGELSGAYCTLSATHLAATG
jgi:hypothetical protein